MGPIASECVRRLFAGEEGEGGMAEEEEVSTSDADGSEGLSDSIMRSDASDPSPFSESSMRDRFFPVIRATAAETIWRPSASSLACFSTSCCLASPR